VAKKEREEKNKSKKRKNSGRAPRTCTRDRGRTRYASLDYRPSGVDRGASCESDKCESLRAARRGAGRWGKKKKREREKKRKRRGEEREITKASTSGCNDAMARVTREEPLNGASALPRIIAAFGSRGKISATPGDRNLAATAAL